MPFLKDIEPFEAHIRPYLGDKFHQVLREDFSHIADARRAGMALKSAWVEVESDMKIGQVEPKAIKGFELLFEHTAHQIDVLERTKRDEEFRALQKSGTRWPEEEMTFSPKNSNGFYTKSQKIETSYNTSGPSVGKLLKGLILGANGDTVLTKSLAEGTNSAGGYSVPVETMPGFIDLLRNKSVLQQAGAQTVLLNSNKVNMATVISDPTPGWRAESAAVSESDPVFGQVAFAPKSLAVLVKVSRELLSDSLNIEQILEDTLANALALQLDYAGLYGSGSSNQPLGLKSVLTTATRNQVLATNGAKLSAQGFYLPIHTAAKKVSEGNDAASAVVLSPRTFFDIQGFTDTTNQPLKPSAFIENNLSFYETNSVPNTLTTGTSNVTSEIFTGNFSNLLLGLRQQLEIQVITETYAGNLQVGFLAHLRADWQVARTNSFWLTQGVLSEV